MKETKNISQEFITEHMSLIESVSSNITSSSKMPPGVIFNDLVSWGVEGLVKAKNNYDDSKGAQFKTYAFYRVRGEILDSLRKEWSYRKPTDYRADKARIENRIAELTLAATDSSSSGEKISISDLISNSAMVYLVSLEDIDAGSQAAEAANLEDDVLDQVDTELYRSVLLEEIKELSDDEKDIVKLFYFENKKQKDIAQELGMSRSKVCRIHMKILEKLRRRLERHFG